MNVAKVFTKNTPRATHERLPHTAGSPQLDISYQAGYALRGLAMLMITFIHSINEYAVYTSELSTTLLVPKYGQLSCSIFFFMSGYGLYRSLSRQQGSLLSYLWVHVKKLLFPFLLAFIGVILALHLFKNADNDTFPINPWNILTLTMPEGMTDLSDVGDYAFSSTKITDLSADFPSPLRTHIENNTDCLVAYFIGAAGDQVPPGAEESRILRMTELVEEYGYY